MRQGSTYQRGTRKLKRNPSEVFAALKEKEMENDPLKQAAIELANAVDELIEEGKKDHKITASFPDGAFLVLNVQEKCKAVRSLTDPQVVHFPKEHPALNSQR